MRYKAVVKYVGTNYYGWQKQPNDISVQAVLEQKLSTYFNKEIIIHGSGRTDRGVHAYGQVFHFDARQVAVSKLRYNLNKMLPSGIEITKIKKCDETFHARLSAKSKTYEYVVVAKAKEPFLAPYALLYYYPLDLKKLQDAAALFVGEHNFHNFTNKGDDFFNHVRKIYAINIKKTGAKYVFTLQGNGFMRSQIRMIIGTILAYNEGKLTLGNVNDLLKSDVRTIVSYKAPAHALFLRTVEY